MSFGPDGRLWAATMGDLGWFERTSGLDWAFRSLRAKLPAEDANVGEVWCVAADEDGATFITNDRILRWNGERFLIWTTAEKRLFHSRSNGRLYVHQKQEGLYEMDNRGRRLVVGRDILRDSAVLWVERRASDWLFGTSAGFFTCDGSKLTPFAPDIVDFIAEGTLSSACRLPDGRIAIGTLKKGIAFVNSDGTVDSFLSDSEGLPSPYINSLFVSRDGELWATTSSHLLRIDIRSRSRVYDVRAGLPRQTYRKITGASGRMFVANESGVYELPPGESRFTPVAPLRGRWQHLQGTEDGVLVSGYRGVVALSGQEIRSVYKTRFDVFTMESARANPAEYLLADYRSIVRRFADGSHRPVVEQLPDLTASLAEDLDGRLWIGTLARGLFVASLRSDTVVEARPAAGLFGLPKLDGPAQVRTNGAGDVMVLANNGAWAWPKAAAKPGFVPVANFPIRSIASVSGMASDGTVWVAHENMDTLAPCVGRISFAGGQARWEPHTVDGLIEAGAPRSIFADTTQPGQTVLWIGGTHALLRHVVGAKLSVTTPRAPLLRAFARRAANETHTPIVDALPYSTALLEFEFAAPEFSRRSLLRIETRIEGVDEEWTVVSPGSRRELTAIRDGQYTVKARVVAETGATSAETVFSFQVLPPWWRTVPGLAIYGLAAALLFFGAYRLRVRTLRRRNAALEAGIRERTKQLEAANAAKTQFVANMSHDIRNPLNGIVGLALALEDTRLDPRQREIVSTLRECTTYLSSLVDDVLDFASIEAGRVELRVRNFGPQELLQSIVATMKADATQSGAVLSVEAGDGVPENLHGDAGRIQQVLVNYVSNALKYAGGNITLSVHAPLNSPGEIEFAVTDRGPGISAADQFTLFTKFSRLRQQRGGEEVPGNGLGLAACRLLADIMGGSVGVQSRAGEGAKFFLRLPLTPAPAQVTAPAACLPSTSVLLVEDTDYNAWAAEAVLAKLGLSCERARTGAEALRLFGTKPFHVVLLDRNLPDMDGTAVARQMRKMESDSPHAVLLAVTAYCTAEDRALCLKSGMDAFVGKPLTPEKLRKVLLEAGARLLASASVQVPAELPAAGLDMDMLSLLSDGSAEGLYLQVQRFVVSLHEAESGLTAACLRDDFATLATFAHLLLSQARMVGCTSLSEAATRLENAAQNEDKSACREWLQRIHDEIECVTEAMRHPRPAAQSV
ncbi:MAG: ATP-binding protein [Opitutaceae bacterium]